MMALNLWDAGGTFWPMEGVHGAEAISVNRRGAVLSVIYSVASPGLKIDCLCLAGWP